MLKVYAYANCDTCRKAIKFLKARDIAHTVIPIRETPPTKAELKRMLGYLDGNVRALFNTSGGDYKALHLKEQLPGMREADALALLAQNGNLVKRPFLLGDDFGTVGFNEAAWAQMLR